MTFDPVYGYLYAAAFIGGVLLPFSVFMWWKSRRSSSINKKG